VQFLVNLLDTVEAPMGARVAAARAVIDFARADAIEAVEARVAELEAIMDHYEGDRHHAP
jgi:hypothetical protein